MNTRLGLFVWLCLLAECLAADVRILSPDTESIVLVPTVNIQGSAVTDTSSGNNVHLVCGSTTVNLPVAAGAWHLNGLTLAAGANRVVVTLGQSSHSIIVVKAGTAIGPRPQQKVVFRWNPGVDDELRELAVNSLDAALSQAQITSFINNVKNRTAQLFAERYDGVANVVVVQTNGTNVHIVDMLANADTLFGQSPFDCGSMVPAQTSEVHVGTYRSAIVDSLELGTDDWLPIKKTDSLATRTEDVAQCLARTAAHETAHSLGLVGDPLGCGWMDGCDGGHNCDQFDIQHPGADRFDNGWYIMDPGPKTLNNARLGEPDTNTRATQRKKPLFNAFDKSYFAIVHPHP